MKELQNSKSPLEQERITQTPSLPIFLQKITQVDIREGSPTQSIADQENLKNLFPNTYGQPLLELEQGKSISSSKPLKIGVVLSGGQAAGGHNVIEGLFDAIKAYHSQSSLLGFLGGPSGIIEGKYRELPSSVLADYRNTGGFDLIGSGRTKIETEEQLRAALKTVQNLKLDGLVIIGGDDSNTNAAVLAEFFLTHQCQTKVIGVPKTIDGDLRSEHVEISFGFDTACKVYSEMIGNIERDALSAKKYYHFIKLMGRSASHITLECALQTHPNAALIGEEIAFQERTLREITEEIADLICERAQHGKHFGVILIPEGLIEFVPEMKQLIKELNQHLANRSPDSIERHLTEEAKKTFSFLPKDIQEQLLLDRDPHGNVQVSHIATEQLFIHTVKNALKQRSNYQGKFNPISHFFGYEGRSAFPSHFDAQYCYTLGAVASCLIRSGKTGYMAAICNLTKPLDSWLGKGIPLTMLMNMEERKGKMKPVIQKALVDLNGEPFKFFVSQRKQWAQDDLYRYPGPIQYFGPSSVVQSVTYTLKLESL